MNLNEGDSDSSERHSAGTYISGILFVGIFLVGLIVLLRAGWLAVTSLHFSFRPVSIAQGVWSGFLWFLHDQAALWITALATAALWRATAMLTRATNIEHASNGPFLNLELRAKESAESTEYDQQYSAEWANEDAQHPYLRQRSNGSSPQFIVLRIENVQTAAHGVASNIIIQARLSFGTLDEVAPHPYVIPRPISKEIILAGRYVEGPIFNVAGLTSWKVELTKVKYRDMLKRPRTGAVGDGGMICRALGNTVSGNTTLIPKVFEPRKGEYSDAD